MHITLTPDDLRTLIEPIVAETLRQMTGSQPEPTADTELLVSAPRAAKMMGLCEKTLWSMADRGEIPRVLIGRAVRYDPSDLAAWVAANKSKTVGQAAAAIT